MKEGGGGGEGRKPSFLLACEQALLFGPPLARSREARFACPNWSVSSQATFLPHPLPSLLLAPFNARSLTLVPCSWLLNRTETLVTQAT